LTTCTEQLKIALFALSEWLGRQCPGTGSPFRSCHWQFWPLSAINGGFIGKQYFDDFCVQITVFSVQIDNVSAIFLKKVFHPSGMVLFPSSHYNYNYKLQFFNFRCWWLSSSSPE
jgi:hypothetical protein